MFITIFVSLTINITVIIISYFIIKYRIEKKVINKNILGKIKKEVNSMILQLNETTLYNINLIEEAVKSLDKKIILADKKKFGLKVDNLNQLKSQKNISVNSFPNKTIFDAKKDFSYSPEKIVNQSQKNTEKIKEEEKKENNVKAVIDENLKNMSTNDKVKYLLSLDMDIDQIKKKLGLTSGELEFLMNIENIKK